MRFFQHILFCVIPYTSYASPYHDDFIPFAVTFTAVIINPMSVAFIIVKLSPRLIRLALRTPEQFGVIGMLSFHQTSFCMRIASLRGILICLPTFLPFIRPSCIQRRTVRTVTEKYTATSSGRRSSLLGRVLKTSSPPRQGIRRLKPGILSSCPGF